MRLCRDRAMVPRSRVRRVHATYVLRSGCDPGSPASHRVDGDARLPKVRRPVSAESLLQLGSGWRSNWYMSRLQSLFESFGVLAVFANALLHELGVPLPL